MPKASTIQGNFSAGELSPLLYGRTDSPKYKQGLDTCTNYIPTLQGPLKRRPGTKYLNNVKDSTKQPVLIPFNFSATQAYMLEFGDQYIRFYANNGQVVTSGTTYKMSAYAYNINAYPLGFNVYASRSSQTVKDGEFSPTFTTVSNGSILEIQSPYTYSDLPLLKWAQNNDTIYLTHPSYPLYKLQRFGNQYWDLTKVLLQDGPYLAYNSYSSFGDNTNVVMSITTGITLGNPMAGFTWDTGPSLTVSAVASSSGLIKITTSASHSYATGQKVYVSGVGGTTEANNNNAFGVSGSTDYWVITVTSPTAFTLNGSTFVHSYTSGGTVQPAVFDYTGQSDLMRNAGFTTSLGNRYWGIIIQVNSASEVVASCITGQNSPGSSATATTWQVGVYGQANGYPSCVCFHQNRLALAGAPGAPQEVDLSYSGQFEVFAISPATTSPTSIPPATALTPNDSSAISEILASNDSNTLRWLKSTAQGLLAGSYSAEWVMAPSSQSDALTSSNFNASQTSFFGTSTYDAVQMGNSTLFIQRASRKVRELNYFFQLGTFRCTDLTELSEHITNPSITKLAVQKETQPLLWAIRSDGALVSMIYDRNDVAVQAGWTKHFLGGQSDAAGTPPLVLSMGIIPSPDLTFDQLWFVVKRWINGASVLTIEYMTKIFDEIALQEDAFQLDCGGTYDNHITISGITNASTAVVTATAHGLSNGNQIKITGVVGLNQSTADIDGNVTISNLVNEKTFVVAGATTNTFQLNDFNGNPISSVSTSFSVYISGGQVRKLVTTISGLTWLENETVSVLADGGIHPNVTVSNSGSITLQYPAAKVQIGYPFVSQGKLLRAEAGAADGTSIGKTRRTTRAAIMLNRSGDLSVGTSFTKLIPVSFEYADQQLADNAVPLFSGIAREGLESAYDFESQICFQQSSALPGTIQSITSFMEEFDV